MPTAEHIRTYSFRTGPDLMLDDDGEVAHDSRLAAGQEIDALVQDYIRRHRPAHEVPYDVALKHVLADPANAELKRIYAGGTHSARHYAAERQVSSDDRAAAGAEVERLTERHLEKIGKDMKTATLQELQSAQRAVLADYPDLRRRYGGVSR
jgi:hypothetical protein